MSAELGLMEKEISIEDHIYNEEKDPFTKIFETVKEIRASIEFVNCQIINRKDIIQQTFYALLTGEHQLFLSRTGMAKSLLARQIFSCFKEINLFEKHLTKDTMPDNLFGAYDIEQMKKGKMFHNTQGSIVTADFAFLDEIFDANDMLLRSLLSLLNEKRLINGQQQVKSSINSVIGAANYLRATEMLEAVLDRFLYKSYITENKDLYTQLAIDQIYQKQFGTVNEQNKKLNLDDFIQVKKVIKSQKIHIPEYLLFLKNYILRSYIEEIRATDPNRLHFTISDRTGVKLQDLLRASAVLDFRTKVEEKDLDRMRYMICMTGKDEEKERLLSISEKAKTYFKIDKKILEDVFQLTRLIRKITYTRGDVKILQSPEVFLTMDKMKKTLKEKGCLFQKIQHATRKLYSFSNKSEINKLIEVIHQYCDLLRKFASKKETLEIIEGLEKNIADFETITISNKNFPSESL